MVFYEGQNNSTSCIDIFILPDSVLEDDEYFTISIATAGTEPHARILSPSVVTFTIQDTTPSDTLLTHDDRVDLSLQWFIIVLAGSCIAVGITSCITTALLSQCLSKRIICCKQTQEKDPIYETTIDDELKMVTTPNEAYSSPSTSQPPPTSDLIPIRTSLNESYLAQYHTRPSNLEMGQAVVTSSSNAAYSSVDWRDNSQPGEDTDRNATM